MQVYSTKLANPAVEVGFTAVDFAAPDARQFAFTPPPGTKVSEGATPRAARSPSRTRRSLATRQRHRQLRPPSPRSSAPAGRRSSLGLELSGVSVAGAGQDKQLQGLLSSIPEVSGTWGKGRVIDGTLFSAVLTDDGRIAVGAVAPEALFAALKAS